MNQSEIKILRCVTRGMAYWDSYSCVHGQRARAAAENLRDAGLLNLITLHSADPSNHRYVAIPPNADWDDTNLIIRPRHNA